MKIRYWAAVILAGCGILGTGLCGHVQNGYAQNWENKYDGVDYTDFNGLRAVRIDLELVGVSIFPKVSAQGEPSAPNTWAEKHGLQVAINANFFSMSTMQNPCSLAVSDGVNWGSGNVATYAQIGFTKDNQLRYHEQPNTDYPAWAYNVVSGSPEIAKDGRVLSVANTQACWDLGHCSGNHLRSGIGVDKSGKYLYLAISSGYVTVEKFAEMMISLGSSYAINLDGGGSSGLYIAGKGYGNVSGRTDAVNLGFSVGPKPAYVCKKAEISNPSSVFYDIAEDHWAFSAVQALKDHQVTTGCGGEEGRPLFCPNCGMRRFEAAQFAAKALGLPDASPEAPSFSDVPAGSEGYGAIEALVQKGIISKAESFRPNDIITRAEAATIIAKSFIENTDAFKNAPTPTFSDVPADHWAYPYVEALVRNCAITGGDGKFTPDGTMNRDGFALMLARGAGYISGQCIFEKKCQTLDEKTCSDNQVNTCMAYESVLTACGENLSCYHGECAECDKTQPASCEEQVVVTCAEGVIQKVDCSESGKLCIEGACVEPPECDDAFEKKCDDDGKVQSCKDGKIIANECPENEYCSEGKCLEKAKDDDKKDDADKKDDDEKDDDKKDDKDDKADDDGKGKPGKSEKTDDDDDDDDEDPDSDDHDIKISSGSSCDFNSGNHHGTPWFMAFALAGLALLRRKRTVL